MARVVTFLLLLLMAIPAAATTRLQRLSDDRYLITHKKQSGVGGQGKALRTANEKAGSLCVVLGYSWFETRSADSQGRAWGQTASATIEVKFYQDEVKEDLNECEALATERQKKKMELALRRLERRRR